MGRLGDRKEGEEEMGERERVNYLSYTNSKPAGSLWWLEEIRFFFSDENREYLACLYFTLPWGHSTSVCLLSFQDETQDKMELSGQIEPFEWVAGVGV